MPWAPNITQRMRPAPLPTIVLMIASLALLFGYHYRIMKHQPPSWMLFLGVFLLFGSCQYWIRSLDNRLSRLEVAYQRLQSEAGPAGGSQTAASYEAADVKPD